MALPKGDISVDCLAMMSTKYCSCMYGLCILLLQKNGTHNTFTLVEKNAPQSMHFQIIRCDHAFSTGLDIHLIRRYKYVVTMLSDSIGMTFIKKITSTKNDTLHRASDHHFLLVFC
jgi:hypothetical protein